MGALQRKLVQMRSLQSSFTHLHSLTDLTLEEKTLSELFNATKDKPSDAKATFPALDVDIGDCKSDFRTVVVSKFLEEDIEDFFQWGQLPLDKCHLVVVNK